MSSHCAGVNKPTGATVAGNAAASGEDATPRRTALRKRSPRVRHASIAERSGAVSRQLVDLTSEAFSDFCRA
jgi:hypothetical protein